MVPADSAALSAAGAASNVRPFKRPGAPALPAAGAARLMLWELPGGCLCPVVGSCLGIHDLRRLLDALFQGSSHASDFELHAGTVRECGARNKLSERLQHELDLRHSGEIERLAACSEDELADVWSEAEASGDVAAALWAIVTHPACSNTLRERMLCELHMAQHHALASQRRLIDARTSAERENERLQAEVLALRNRCERLAAAPAHASPTWARAFRRAARLVMPASGRSA